jgi:hypothetical protein
MSGDMTNEEMEESILGFIDKLENPEGQSDMDIEEAFEYVEATLNYKYVNYDYSKCASTVEFTSSITISPDQNNMMTMGAISVAYDSILADWQQHYYSVEDNIKTPIVFDITDISSTEIKYTMVVGYGYLDLSLWDKSFQPAASTFFKTAASQYTYQLYAQLNNNLIQLNPSGTRTYSWPVVPTYYIQPTSYPSNPSTATVNPEPLPPLGNGYTDYKLFKSDFGASNYHLYLNTTEYNYHRDMLSVIYLDILANNLNANFVILAQVEATGLNPNYYHPRHNMKIKLGHRYFTLINAEQL